MHDIISKIQAFIYILPWMRVSGRAITEGPAVMVPIRRWRHNMIPVSAKIRTQAVSSCAEAPAKSKLFRFGSPIVPPI